MKLEKRNYEACTFSKFNDFEHVIEEANEQ